MYLCVPDTLVKIAKRPSLTLLLLVIEVTCTYYKVFVFLDCEMTFKHVSCMDQEVWAVSSDGAIQRRLGVTADNPAGIAWQHVLSGSFVHVTSRGYPQ